MGIMVGMRDGMGMGCVGWQVWGVEAATLQVWRVKGKHGGGFEGGAAVVLQGGGVSGLLEAPGVLADAASPPALPQAPRSLHRRWLLCARSQGTVRHYACNGGALRARTAK